MAPQDKSYISLAQALRRVLAQPQLAIDLKSRDTRPQAIEKLKIDEDMATEIINILMDLESMPPGGGLQAPVTPVKTKSDRDFLYEAYGQLRTAYLSSIGMSVVMFIIGVSFLAIAAIRSFTDPQSVVMTSVIGGIGVVQIVALFYRNPLVDIARTVSNTQQAKIAVMSYLLGISLLNQQLENVTPTDAHMQNLIQLTETTLQQFQTYVEGSKTKIRTAKPSPSDQTAAKIKEE